MYSNSFPYHKFRFFTLGRLCRAANHKMRARERPSGGMSFRGLVLAVVVYWLLLAGVQAKKKKKRLEDESASPPSADKTLAMHHHQRGTMAHMQGDLVGAIEAFRSAIQAKPDFAYAYYRLGFVQHELRQANPKRANDDPVPAFKAALALNPWDEMSHYSFGQALQDDERIAEAIAVFKGITSKINSKSAQAYWSLGKLLARGVDEFDSDSDPNAPDDPSLLFEQAARLNPMNFKPDGTRVRLVELRTPEVEQREEREVQKRRERILDEMHEGKHSFKYADEL